MLLKWLGPGTAAELLKEAPPETVTRIAAELAYLDATGQSSQESTADCAKEFFVLLNERQRGEVRGERFVRQMLASVVGEQRAGELLDQVQEMVLARDPFLQVRSAEAEDIANALQGEGARVASLVLAELPPKKSAALLALLPALHGMTRNEVVTPEARMRVAIAVMTRLRRPRGPADRRPQTQGQLRRAALILRGLTRGLRDQLLRQLAEADQEVSDKVAELMVTWEDIPHVGNRAIQEVLRSADARQLALALVGADEQTISKVHENCSERMAALIEEETSLLSSPKPEEVQATRERILEALRELNATGDLTFEEEQQDV